MLVRPAVSRAGSKQFEPGEDSGGSIQDPANRRGEPLLVDNFGINKAVELG